jgi:hypothetical protein
MGSYFRRSINVGGGLRLNLSKRGVGMSAGVPGLRFGISPGGRRYVHCGAGGIYYRKSFASGGASRQPAPAPTPSPVAVGSATKIDSGDVRQMVDSSAMELLLEIQTRHRRIRIHRWFLLLMLIAVIAAAVQNLSALTAIAIVVAVIGTPIWWLVDRQRKTVQLSYDLDPTFTQRYQQLLNAFDHFCRSHRVWLIESEEAVHDRKYSGGAGHTIERKAVSPRRGLPPYFRCNLSSPMLPAGRQTLYLLPDTILVFDGPIG